MVGTAIQASFRGRDTRKGKCGEHRQNVDSCQPAMCARVLAA